jgi:phage anti-repressor protein
MLEATRPNISCPKCRQRVEVNTLDYYECRECHTQYSHSGLHEELGWERVVLIDMAKDTVISVLVMDEKGKGEFKIDRDMAKIEAAIKEREENESE